MKNIHLVARRACNLKGMSVPYPQGSLVELRLERMETAISDGPIQNSPLCPRSGIDSTKAHLKTAHWSIKTMRIEWAFVDKDYVRIGL